jgi:Gas vesicle protein
MASEREPATSVYNRRQLDTRRMEVQRPGGPANLADILERVLDKGIVIAGDIQINLLDIELLTVKLRLLVASVERAQEMGINWWESDPTLSSRAQELEEENEDLRGRLERLEEAAGLPAPKPGEEVVVETRRREVVEEEDGEQEREVSHVEHEEVHEAPLTREDLMRRAQELDLPGRSTMDKDELARAVDEAEAEQQ